MPGQVFHKRNVFHKGFSTHAPALFQTKSSFPVFFTVCPHPKKAPFPASRKGKFPFSTASTPPTAATVLIYPSLKKGVSLFRTIAQHCKSK